jgi:hypothetical protein
MAHSYESLIIAEVLVAAGNCTWNDVADVLSDPKSRTHTAPSAPALYIKAPRAVITPVHDTFAKVTRATPLDIETVGVNT